MSTYFTIITDVGTAKIAAAMANSTSVTLTQMAVGDGNGLPVAVLPGRTALVNETFRAGINLLDQNAGDLSQFMAELLVPAASGGWTTREVGLFDSDGDLIAYSNFPDTYKPTIAEGATQDLIIQMHIKVDNYSVISVSIDPSLVQATRTWVLSVLNGITSITMNTSDVTLTEGQSDRSIIIITGALTGNRNLIFPNIEKQWTVINNTTGNFTITCKTSSGTGITVVASDIIYSDGINIYSALYLASSRISFDNTDTTLNGADIESTTKDLDVRSRTNWWKLRTAGSLVAPSGGAPSLCAVSDTDFAWVEAAGDVIRRYTYDHSAETITKVGIDSDVLTDLSWPGITALSGTRVAVVGEVYGLAAFDWDVDLEKYVQIGNILTIPGMLNPCIAALSSNRVAVWCTTSGNNVLRTFDFDGTDWAQVGNAYAAGEATTYTCMAAMSETRVAINLGSQGKKLQAMEFDETDWTKVGNASGNVGSLFIGESDLCALNSTDFLYVDSHNQNLTIYRFVSSGWAKIIVLGNMPIPTGQVPSMCSLTDDVVIYKESNEANLLAFKIKKLSSNQPYRPF